MTLEAKVAAAAAALKQQEATVAQLEDTSGPSSSLETKLKKAR